MATAKKTAFTSVKKASPAKVAKKPAKKSAKKTSRYGPLAARNIEREMKAMEAGTLHSGSPDGPLVKSRKQAIAIALSETRKSGGKLPPDPNAPKT